MDTDLPRRGKEEAPPTGDTLRGGRKDEMQGKTSRSAHEWRHGALDSVNEGVRGNPCSSEDTTGSSLMGACVSSVFLTPLVALSTPHFPSLASYCPALSS